MGDSDNYYRMQCCCICSYTKIKSWQLCVVSKSVIHMRLTVTMQHVNCAGIVRVMMRCLVRRTPPSFLIKALQPNTFYLLLHTHLLSLAIFHLTLPSLYILFRSVPSKRITHALYLLFHTPSIFRCLSTHNSLSLYIYCSLLSPFSFRFIPFRSEQEKDKGLPVPSTEASMDYSGPSLGNITTHCLVMYFILF